MVFPPQYNDVTDSKVGEKKTSKREYKVISAWGKVVLEHYKIENMHFLCVKISI